MIKDCRQQKQQHQNSVMKEKIRNVSYFKKKAEQCTQDITMYKAFSRKKTCLSKTYHKRYTHILFKANAQNGKVKASKSSQGEHP